MLIKSEYVTRQSVPVGDRFLHCLKGTVSGERLRRNRLLTERCEPASKNRAMFSIQSIVVAETLAELRCWNPERCLTRLKKAMDQGELEAGKRLKALLRGDRIAARTQEPKQAVAEALEALTRGIPIGLLFRRDVIGLVEVSHQVSSLTHPEREVRFASVALNAIVSRGVRGWELPDAVAFAAELIHHGPTEVVEFLEELSAGDSNPGDVAAKLVKLLGESLVAAADATALHESVSEPDAAVLPLQGAIEGAVAGAFGFPSCGKEPSLPQDLIQTIATVADYLWLLSAGD